MESKRILVIDDEPQVCGLLKRVLEKAGYEVETVGNPSETVASILVQRYDLVTVDLKMPGMDGTDICNPCPDHRRHLAYPGHLSVP